MTLIFVESVIQQAIQSIGPGLHTTGKISRYPFEGTAYYPRSRYQDRSKGLTQNKESKHSMSDTELLDAMADAAANSPHIQRSADALLLEWTLLLRHQSCVYGQFGLPYRDIMTQMVNEETANV